MAGLGGAGKDASSGSAAELVPSEVLTLAGGSESGLFCALASQLAEYASIDLPAAQAAVDSASPASSPDDASAAVACAVKEAVQDPWLTERLRVALSVARHFAKKSALIVGAGSGCEALAFARLGLEPTLADWPGPVRDFAAWRLAQSGFEADCTSPADLPQSRFDVIYCSRFADDSLDRESFVSEVFSRMAQDAILYLAPDSPVYEWGQHLLAALGSRGLRRAWDCGHLLVYCNDAPVYNEVSIATHAGETVQMLRRLSRGR
jgi:hypothetical protein